MPPNTVKGRNMSNPSWPFMQLQDPDGVLSPENFVNKVGDIYGSQHVILYGPTGEVLRTTENQLHTKPPVRLNPGMLFDKARIGDNEVVLASEVLDAGNYRKFTLFLNIDSTGAPTTIQIEVQFRDPNRNSWHTYKQGLFASLFYEDTDVANVIYECFTGDLPSEYMRLFATVAGGAAGAYFDVTASADFWG